jgi:hypothetical protein
VQDELRIDRPLTLRKCSTTHGHYHDHLTAETRDLAERIYARDLEAFGYRW